MLSQRNLGEWCFFGSTIGGTSEQSAKVFSKKILFFTNLRKFSPAKVSCYAV